MNANPEKRASKALFTLPTGLESVSDGSSLKSVARAKQAAVLFDEIVVEAGLRVVELSSSGVITILDRGPGNLSKALVESWRDHQNDAKSGLAIAASGEKVELYIGTNLPRIDGATYVEKIVAERLIGEYHSGVLHELARLDAPWVKVVSIHRPLGDSAEIRDESLSELPSTSDDCELFSKLELDPDDAEKLGAELTGTAAAARDQNPAADPGTEMSAQAMLGDDLVESIEIGNRLGAVPALSGAFARVAAERGVPVGLPGSESLGLVVPNFSGLPWEAVAEFRDHPGAEEARERLREFEAVAASGSHGDAAELVRETGRAVTTGLVGAVKDLAPDLPDDLARTLGSTAVGFVPVVGQFASLAISVGDIIAALRAHEQFEQSWIAAVFQLRDASIDSLVDW